MSLPNVEMNIQDGSLGIVGRYASIPQAKVGLCSAGTVGTLYTFTSAADVRGTLGYGPLADAVIHTLSAGAKTVYAVPVTQGAAGSCGAVTPGSENEGLGTVSAAGAPHDAWDVRVEILKAGGQGEAVFRYSLDGGQSHWSKRYLVPVDGSFVIPNTGVTLTFSDLPGDFAAEDVYDFATTAPTAAVGDLGAAVDVLLESSKYFELIHVVGPTAAAIWIALAAKAVSAMASYARYIHIVCEAAYLGEGDDVADWVADREAEALDVESVRLSVCGSWGRVSCPADLVLKSRNLASVILGRVGAVKVNVSPGRTDLGGLPMIAALLPDAEEDPIKESHIQDLDDARYTTVRTLFDVAGFYVSNYRMMAAEGSDFTWGENRRTMDKACRLVRQRAVRSIHREADEIDQLQAELQEELDRMKGAGEIREGRIDIPEDQDVIGTGTLLTQVRIQPVGTIRWLVVDMGFENPFLSQ